MIFILFTIVNMGIAPTPISINGATSVRTIDSMKHLSNTRVLVMLAVCIKSVITTLTFIRFKSSSTANNNAHYGINTN